MSKKHHRFKSEKPGMSLNEEQEVKMPDDSLEKTVDKPETECTCEGDSSTCTCCQEQLDQTETQEAEIQKWKDLAMRSQAEMENLRKRTQIDIEKANRYATTSFAKELLGVADCLAGAIDFARKEIDELKGKDKECLPFLENLLKGVEMTQKQLKTAFERQGIQKMETANVVFDPNLHKVIQEVEDETKEPGTIVQELQSGYTIFGDRVLREAMVIVSK